MVLPSFACLFFCVSVCLGVWKQGISKSYKPIFATVWNMRNRSIWLARGYSRNFVWDWMLILGASLRFLNARLNTFLFHYVSSLFYLTSFYSCYILPSPLISAYYRLYFPHTSIPILVCYLDTCHRFLSFHLSSALLFWSTFHYTSKINS